MTARLRQLCEAVRRERGEWTLFAMLNKRKAPQQWDLILAAPWLANTNADLKYISLQLIARFDPLEMSQIGIVLILDRPDDVANAVRSLLNGRPGVPPGGEVRRRGFDFRGRRIRRGYVLAAHVPAPAAVPA